MLENLKENQFEIRFSNLPYYLKVIGAVSDAQTMRGAPFHKKVEVFVRSSLHTDKSWNLLATYDLEYWNDHDPKPEILQKIVARFGLTFEGRYA